MPGRPPPISRDEHAARLEKARRLTRDAGCDALLIGAGQSLDYFAGIGWSASERLVALVLPTNGSPAIICPGFEQGSLEASLGIDARILLWQEHEEPTALIARELSGKASLAVDPLLAFATVDALRKTAPSLTLRNAAPIVDDCRGIKSAAELATLSYAKRITLEVQRSVASILHQGISTSEIRAYLDAAHQAAGADGGATFAVVQFGVATSFPHGLPGEQALAEGDVVLVDTGCQVNGYNADITRTYVYGEPTDEVRRVWSIEREAQLAAFDAVRPGVPCEAIDAAARAVLERHGFGPDYRLPGLPHRTGHGIGLAVHEAPYLVRGETTPLAPGMCFSDEPMIVVPGRFGIRLEDHFHVTETGAAWFTEPSPSIDAPFG